MSYCFIQHFSHINLKKDMKRISNDFFQKFIGSKGILFSALKLIML